MQFKYRRDTLHAMNVDLRLLRYALALAEQGNFARAAAAVHISQPAFSRGISELERRTGTLLFERSRNGAHPTDAGRLFLEQAREVALRAADLGREMDLLRGLDTGELSIGAGVYSGPMMVGRAIARLARQHPAVRMRIINDIWLNLADLVRRRAVDLAVIDVSGLPDASEFHFMPLLRHQGYLVARAGHPLLRSAREITFGDVVRYPFAGGSRVPPPMLKQMLEENSSAARPTRDVKSLPSIACDSLTMIKTIVRGSDTVALLPLNVVMADVRAGKLAVLPLIRPWLQASFAVVRLAHRSLSPLGEKFIALLMEEDHKLLRYEQRAAEELFEADRSAKLAV
jgi:DNA-binding transcriptional LysR family regulator